MSRKRPKTDYQKAWDTAWSWMSRYIRLRDCLKTSGTPEWGRCVTCGKPIPFGLMDAGHFVPGRKGPAMWDERNCHGQCRACNRFQHGSLLEYRDYMDQEYGEEVIEELRVNGKLPFFGGVPELRAIAEDYRCRYHEMKSEQSKLFEV